LTLLTIPSLAADYSKVPTERLIDQLALTDSVAPGIDDTAIFDVFIGDMSPAQFAVGVLGSESPVATPQMRELVRRGPSALSALIDHLSDPRPTKLTLAGIGTQTFGGEFFSNEYDGKDQSQIEQWRCRPCLERPISGGYTVRIADVCYALIGQIVNRRLLAVRYQPSAITIVNSPLEAPELIDRVKKDWGTANADDLRVSLLTDLNGSNDLLFGPALTRLRFYFPDTYRALDGTGATKRAAFELTESRRAQNQARSQ
jgi:hypothetical protein